MKNLIHSFLFAAITVVVSLIAIFILRQYEALSPVACVSIYVVCLVGLTALSARASTQLAKNGEQGSPLTKFIADLSNVPLWLKILMTLGVIIAFVLWIRR